MRKKNKRMVPLVGDLLICVPGIPASSDPDDFIAGPGWTQNTTPDGMVYFWKIKTDHGSW